MALSMDEQRMLAEIERRLADDDPVLAARLTAFRLPRLTFATRSARSRLMASLLMLVVVGVVSVFVYALIPFARAADHVGVQPGPGGGRPPGRVLLAGLGEVARTGGVPSRINIVGLRQVSEASAGNRRRLRTAATSGSGTAPGSPGPSGRAGTHR
jgi:Protein of unknown function (DUF3040)